MHAREAPPGAPLTYRNHCHGTESTKGKGEEEERKVQAGSEVQGSSTSRGEEAGSANLAVAMPANLGSSSNLIEIATRLSDLWPP